MELPSKFSEQVAFEIRPKVEEDMLSLMDNSTHEELSSQPVQTNKKQFKIADTFLTGCNGNFNLTNKNNKFHFTVSFNDAYCSRITIPAGAYEVESLHVEIKRLIFKDGYFTEEN